MTLNVGIIGCGSITKFRHAPEYFANQDCKIVGFFDPVAERTREMTDSFGGKAYESYHELIKDITIDAVSVCTSNATHAQITIEALNAGKHVLCEKPMAVNSAEAEAMVKAAASNNRILMAGHNQRFFPAHMKAKEIINSGELGKVLSFRSCFKHKGPETWSADKGANTWFFDKKLASMGALGDLGIHKLDLVRWLLGEEITSVFAQLSTLDKRFPNGELIEIEDNAIILGRTASGRTGTFEVSWTNYGNQDNSTILYCEKGAIKIYCDPEIDIAVELRDGSTVKYKFADISTNEKQTPSGVIDSFIASITNQRPPVVSGKDGYEAIAIVEACIRSSQKGVWETITQ